MTDGMVRCPITMMLVDPDGDSMKLHMGGPHGEKNIVHIHKNAWSSLLTTMYEYAQLAKAMDTHPSTIFTAVMPLVIDGMRTEHAAYLWSVRLAIGHELADELDIMTDEVCDLYAPGVVEHGRALAMAAEEAYTEEHGLAASKAADDQLAEALRAIMADPEIDEHPLTYINDTPKDRARVTYLSRKVAELMGADIEEDIDYDEATGSLKWFSPHDPYNPNNTDGG